jgi:putative cell wall-binding protein
VKITSAVVRRVAATVLCTTAVVGSLATFERAASAFQAVGGGNLSSIASTTVFPGKSSQPLATAVLTLIDGSPVAGDGWSAGDTITFTLARDPAGTSPLCGGTANPHQSVAIPALPTVTATTNGSVPYIAFTVSPTSSGQCSGNDGFAIRLTANAPGDTTPTTFKISGLRIDLGSQFSDQSPVFLVAVASAGSPFGSAAVQTTTEVAVIRTTTLGATSTAGAANGRTNVRIGVVMATDVTGGAISGSLTFRLSGGDLFASPGTLSGPAGVTITGPSETSGSATLTYALAGASPAGGQYLLSSAAVSFAGPSRAHVVTATTGTGTPATLVGDAAIFAVTAAEERVGGLTRYGTAQLLFDGEFGDRGTAHAAVLTSGTNFPDALSADTLASRIGTGVLLTDPATLSAETLSQLRTDDIDTVYIVGGATAVSAAVEQQIAALHVLSDPTQPTIAVQRIAGADRYATNNAVDEQAGNQGTHVGIIASGAGFADALAVGPILYDQGYPLVLTDPNNLVAAARQTLTDLQLTHVIIVGGTAAISAGVEAALTAAGITIDYRIAGADRTQTAAMIATWARSGLPLTSTYPVLAGLPGWAERSSAAWISRGDTFADALAAGPVAGDEQRVIVSTTNSTTLGAGIPQYFAHQGGTVTTVIALGGASALTSTLVDQAVAALS